MAAWLVQVAASFRLDARRSASQDRVMTILSLAAKQDHLEKVARTSDPIKAISEFVWNALDADATEVAVNFVRNALGGIQEIRISDNGVGISRNRGEKDFASLGESWKREKRKTNKLNRALHGKEGRGRLRFYTSLGSVSTVRVSLFGNWNDCSNIS
jgi:hypothetical protein